MTSSTPTTPADRALILDALRGFALFGVCLANLQTFTGGASTLALPTDAAAEFVYHALIEGKFYSIFSLLFGLGFALQLGRRGDTEATTTTYRRRLRILAAIGFMHMLLWFGDILLLYALLGMVLVRLRGLDERRALRWAVVLLALPIAIQLPVLAFPDYSIFSPFGDAGMQLWRAIGGEPAATPGWRDLLSMALPNVLFRAGALLDEGRPFKVLAMFLIGMLVGRRRVWEHLDAHASQLRRICAWGFGIGLPVCLLMAGELPRTLAGDDRALGGIFDRTLYAIGVVPLALAYAAGFALLWRRPPWQRVLVWLAPTGRMALTNYLTQTVLAVLLLWPMGLDLGGRLGATLLLPWTLATVTLQTLFSRWWLARHRFGPMEGLWRELTYKAGA